MRPYEVTKIREGLYRLNRACACGTKTRVMVRSQALWDYEHGKKVKDAFPELTRDQRESIFITGICSKCWDEMFKPEEEEEAAAE